MALATLSPAAGDSIVFEVSADRIRTWHSAKRTKRTRYATHDVHLQQPRKEYLGPGLDTLDLSIRIDVDRGLNPRNELDLLHAYCDTGEVLTLVQGGVLIADFTIDGVNEDWLRTDADGLVTAAVVELHLGEYV